MGKFFSNHLSKKILLRLWVGSSALASILLSGCASHGKAIAPEDMPAICQDLDFNRDASMREICGVKTRTYMAYRNVPEHRNLLLPKEGKIVKKDGILELRLASTLPIELPKEFNDKIYFDEKVRRDFIKSKMDYCEFFPENSDKHVKLIRLDIPLDLGGEISVCYTLEAKVTTVQRKTGYASHLEPMECADFQKLKEKPTALGQ
jgi:hypothetical protein